ncbi:MAG: Uma2 family endonuclease, partial [Bacteroidota bacterium]
FNFDIAFEFAKWNKEYKLGIAFDSSTGFTLPNKAVRSPDLSWIQMDRWNALSEEDQMGFAPIVPEFIIEIRSKSDSIETLKEKMKEYIAQGVKLGWLIDPPQQKVWIYRAEGSIEIKNSFAEPLLGESVLPGFVLNLSALWG